MPVQPPKRPVVVAPKKPVVAPKPLPRVPARIPVSAPARQPVTRRDMPMAAPMQAGSSPLMNAIGQAGQVSGMQGPMSPQANQAGQVAANTRPMIGQVNAGNGMFGASRPQAPQSNPSQFTRVSAGQYRGPNGQIVNSAMNPGNMPQRQPMPRPGMNQPVGIGQFEQGQMGPPNGMNAFNGASAQPGQAIYGQPQTGGGLQLAPGMQQPGMQPQQPGMPQLAVDNNLPVQGAGATLPRMY